MEPGRMFYRRYLRDSSVSVPRTTLWRYGYDGRLWIPMVPDIGDFPPRSPSPVSHASTSFDLDLQPNNSHSPSLDSLSLSTPTCSPSPYDSPYDSPPTNDQAEEAFADQAEEASLPPHLFDPLYPAAEITVCGALCAAMQFCISNQLTFTSISELLKLLAILLPSENLLPTSLYKFKKFFQQFSSIHDHKLICLKCKGANCSCEHQSSANVAHLVHLDIHKQLEKVISDNVNSLHFPENLNDGILRDIWDGSVLQSLSAPGRFFSDRHSLALSISTDGVALFKSSTISLWPVYVVILNLPACIRMNADNIILCALWIGSTKPIMQLLLEPICDYLQILSSAGITLNTSLGPLLFKAKLVMGIFDLPAKAAVLCSKQFNGEFGCSVCLHPGKRLANNARVYLPNSTYSERSHSQVISASIEAEKTNTFVQGIIGMSPFASVLDLVISIPVDYMHAVLEGVTRWLVRAWFDSKYHGEAFYIGRNVQAIDIQLMRQCPPSEFSRPPRSIQRHISYWKASELRNWLLVYSLPLLLGYLPSLYWHHYALLVCAIHIMLGNSITCDQLAAADQMIKDFYTLLPELYGESSCTANAHLLSHLTKYVHLWGPLWTHSAFGFESKNGQLKHLFHGKSDANIVKQLLFNVDVACTLQQVHTQLMECESEATLAYLHLTPRCRPNMVSIGSHTYILGQHKVITPTDDQSAALGTTGNIEVFMRLYKDGVIYHSTSYSRSTYGKRNNTYCRCYNTADGTICFGQIELFMSTPAPIALVRLLIPCSTSLINKAGHPCRSSLAPYQEVDLLSLFIVPVSQSNQYCIVPVDHILSKTILITVHSSHYCIVQPNNVEHH